MFYLQVGKVYTRRKKIPITIFTLFLAVLIKSIFRRPARSWLSLQTEIRCISVIIPGKTLIDYFYKVEEILSLIKPSDFASGWRTVVEFRNASWHTCEAFEMLDEYHAALMLHNHLKAKKRSVE